ncbi:MAG: hypothetical protein ACYDCQ_13405 [Dehalococcoidia bacterium]
MTEHGVGSTGEEMVRESIVPCRLSSRTGDYLASGTALIAPDTSDGFHASVQSLQPVGPVMLAIFAKGELRFQLEIAGAAPVLAELVASRWLEGGQRVCFFRSVAAVGLQAIS